MSRPRWLLSRSIGDKVKDYRKDRKLWAMAGFQFQHNLFRSRDPRDPGEYGQYHEGGWRPGRYRVSAPRRFLRRAKAETYWTLLQKIAEINEKMVGEIFAEKRRRTAAARELREMQRKARKAQKKRARVEIGANFGILREEAPRFERSERSRRLAENERNRKRCESLIT